MPSRQVDRPRKSSHEAGGDRRNRSRHQRCGEERDISPRPRSNERPVYRLFKRTNSSTGSSSSYRANPTQRSSTASDTSRDRHRRKVYNVVDFGMERRASTSHLSGTRSNTTPYPSFSKAHSKEIVVPPPRDKSPSSGRRFSSYNPSTERSSSPTKSPSHQRSYSNATKPILGNRSSAYNPDIRKVQSRGSIRSDNSHDERDMNGGETKLDDPLQRRGPTSRFSASKTSLRDAEEGKLNLDARSPPITAASSPLRPTASSPARAAMPTKSARQSPSRPQTLSHRSALFNPTDSDATSIAPERKLGGQAPTLLSHRDTSPSSDPESFPRTPNGHDALSAVPDDRKETPVVEVLGASNSEADFGSRLPNPNAQVPLPPPPPPPPLDVTPSEIPKVDYLLRNGGLSRAISKRFVNAPYPTSPAPYQQHSSPQVQSTKAPDASVAFAPYKTFLDDLDRILSQKGSVAVATGYKSASRRLVDRLETAFGRNITSPTCTCVMCKPGGHEKFPESTDTTASWAEVFELVAGRRELPAWPPFILPASSTGLGLSGLSQKPPMQKLDVDVPEEYREHYIRQSKKTKQAVDKWLAGQPEDQGKPPAEVDDETLIFAMLTYLDPADRSLFTALVRGLSTIPVTRSPTPALAEPKSELLSKVATALQRLYRLSKPPRDPESGMYLLKYPNLHGALVTLASVTNQEWEMIVSGHFDGFLVNGGDSQLPSTGAVSSRGPTPFRKTGATPASSFPPSAASPKIARQTSFRTTTGNMAPSPAPTPSQASSGPAQIDEETEIAVLAEVEREIYTGMETLEDAFELLHLKAENIRRALRERGAGLSLSARMKYEGSAAELDARLGTPFDGEGADRSFQGTPLRTGSGWSNWAPSQRESMVGANLVPESDDGLDDVASLAPDDSASNIGGKDKSRHRHHRRRRPRRTPAPVDEGDE